MARRQEPYHCPACHTRLTKKYLRSLSEVEWLKLQVSNWMTAWGAELEARREMQRTLAQTQKAKKHGPQQRT